MGSLGSGVDWGAFPGRFTTTAGKVLAKMQSNAQLLADHMRHGGGAVGAGERPVAKVAYFMFWWEGTNFNHVHQSSLISSYAP